MGHQMYSQADAVMLATSPRSWSPLPDLEDLILHFHRQMLLTLHAHLNALFSLWSNHALMLTRDQHFQRQYVIGFLSSSSASSRDPPDC